MRLYYVANARLPNDKAHGIQIAKTCEAFAKIGIDVTLVVPSRKNSPASFQEFYGLQTPIAVHTIRVPDWYLKGPFGFALSSLFFMIGYVWYLRKEKRAHSDAFAYSVDMDSFSFTALLFSGMPYAAEMHGIKKKGLLRSFFFTRAKGIVAINNEVKRSLLKTFAIPEGHVLEEPNGVDLALFTYDGTKADARQKLSIQPQERVALYVGRMYAWKGLEILAQAATLERGVSWYIVGASREEFQAITNVSNLPPNLFCMGQVQPKDLAPWFAAADTFLIVGTKHNEESYRYTAPMKLFEYMAVQTPIVVCDTPALRSIVGNVDGLYWYEPDNAEHLVQKVKESYNAETGSLLVEAQKHSWDARAKRLHTFLHL